jgi:hypothetical protein
MKQTIRKGVARKGVAKKIDEMSVLKVILNGGNVREAMLREIEGVDGSAAGGVGGEDKGAFLINLINTNKENIVTACIAELEKYKNKNIFLPDGVLAMLFNLEGYLQGIYEIYVPYFNRSDEEWEDFFLSQEYQANTQLQDLEMDVWIAAAEDMNWKKLVKELTRIKTDNNFTH